MAQSRLFSPFRLNALSLPNRIVVAPMCQYSATGGKSGAWHAVHLGSLALSGAGLLLVEATGVSPEGRISLYDLGLYDDACAEAMAQTLASVRAVSPVAIGVQLAHAGRKASTKRPWEGGGPLEAAAGGWAPMGPSALAYAPGHPVPTAMDEAAIEGVVADFAAAARRAAAIGYDAVELHAAHGYLLHQFLSPLTNHRGDGWGGDLAGRMRLVLAAFDAVRAAFPAGRPVGVRVSATDWAPGGWDVAQTCALAAALAARGCAFVHVSSGGLVPGQKIPVGPNYQVPLARAVKEASGLPTIAVGLITEPAQAESIVATGDADLVGLARAMLYDPRWPWHAAAALGAKAWAAPQYARCQPSVHPDLFVHAWPTQK